MMSVSRFLLKMEKASLCNYYPLVMEAQTLSSQTSGRLGVAWRANMNLSLLRKDFKKTGMLRLTASF